MLPQLGLEAPQTKLPPVLWFFFRVQDRTFLTGSVNTGCKNVTPAPQPELNCASASGTCWLPWIRGLVSVFCQGSPETDNLHNCLNFRCPAARTYSVAHPVRWLPEIGVVSSCPIHAAHHDALPLVGTWFLRFELRFYRLVRLHVAYWTVPWPGAAISGAR